MSEQKDGALSVLVCQGTGCVSNKSEPVREALEREVARLGIGHRVRVDFSGCHGFCQQGPVVDVLPEGIFYAQVRPEDAAEIVSSHFVEGKPVARLFYRDPVTGEATPRSDDVPFYKLQKRLILRNCGLINPERLDDYLGVGGYQGLRTALKEMTPERVIEEMKRSGLRGRGGAGFPTWQKWQFCRSSPGKEKYVICNADEGDPGAFMDRSILEADPFAVIEGLTIAGYAIGASHGFMYVRAEYPLAVKRVLMAIQQAEQRGLLGDRILGSDFSFRIGVREGAGAFVCGEETALIASIEGKRGMPRPRPPFPAVKGVFGKPTNINNVKSLASAAGILRFGADWFCSVGTEQSRGTAIFSLTGKVANAGLVEVPMGTPIEHIVFGAGGGVSSGKRLKAVQTGGPSGGTLPVSLIHLPAEYESLTKVGSIMGSGGMVVCDEDNCMVDLARFFLSFTQSESCGKCVPCRVGTRQMLEMLERITRGEGKEGDIEQLEKLAQRVKDTSLCGLGQTAPNPVLTSIRYFREEYEEHIRRHFCRAAACKGLVVAPCHHVCPAGVQAYRYVRLCKEGKFAEALAVNRETVPFPAVLGRVCTHACETRCTRGKVDQPISIRALKRMASEHDDGSWRERERHDPPTGKRVAVVGSGPAGLTCAAYLAKKGHGVTVFEALPQVGGMLRVGIPTYRLPREILDQEIAEIERVGVTIKTSSPVSSLGELKGQGFDAVFVAVGAHRGQRMGAEGEEQVATEAVTFLRQVALGEPMKIGQRVAVVGGGNAAIDAARTALRLGAKEVTILYRRTRQEMPALEEEVHEAEAEGVTLVLLVAPTKMWREGEAIKVQLQRMKLGEMDASGRRRPEPVAGSEFVVELDTIIAAVGQVPQLPPGFDLPATRGNTLTADEDSLATPVAGVFAGGDCVTGPATVIQSIAQGRRAAISIDRYLGGDGDISEVLLPPEVGAAATVPVDEGERPRVPIPMVKGVHLQGFAACELGYSPDMAVDEARRCLNCDLERGG
ncbi:MAG: NADH-ubiquinone oxidoreductase-F iron-sulfur binding region domain-containing protein [Chloroflexota bacterium]